MHRNGFNAWAGRLSFSWVAQDRFPVMDLTVRRALLVSGWNLQSCFSPNPCLRISSSAFPNRLDSAGPMWMKRNACAGGVPRSAGPRNSTALLILPDTVISARSATVPFATVLDRRKVPPVVDSLHRTPVTCCAPSATNTRSLFGTFTRGARTESRCWSAMLCIAEAFHRGALRSTLRKATADLYLAADPASIDSQWDSGFKGCLADQSPMDLGPIHIPNRNHDPGPPVFKCWRSSRSRV